jgi:RNA polymerase sigma factor (sigma-70 family)
MSDPTDFSESQEKLVELAVAGDRAALERLCHAIEGPIYRLAVRMLGDLGEAEDAAQEILVQTVTRLAQFEGRSRFSTWVYTIASRHLLRFRVSQREQRRYLVSWVAGNIDSGLAVTEPAAEPEGEVALLERELRWTCTQAMLLCLSREERLAILLAEVLGATDTVGAAICEITPLAFRKRLQRARAQLRPLMEERCGIVNAGNPCRCRRQAAAMQRHRGLSLDWANQPEDVQARLLRADQQLAILSEAGQLFALDPPIAPPHRIWQGLTAAFPELFK